MTLTIKQIFIISTKLLEFFSFIAKSLSILIYVITYIFNYTIVIDPKQILIKY